MEAAALRGLGTEQNLLRKVILSMAENERASHDKREMQMMNEQNESFNYTYSAKQQAEIDNIRKKYLPKEADKMEHLRKLDKNATKLGTVASLIVGIVSTLVMGFGMCCTMLWNEHLFIPGIVIGVIGIIGICAAYPLYVRITQKQRTKIAAEILQLADELSE